VAVARMIAISTVIVLVAWKLGGRTVYDYTRAGTALTLHEAYTHLAIRGNAARDPWPIGLHRRPGG